MQVSLFVIGDEILSGKRQDQHLPKVIELLKTRGMDLAEARFLGDSETQIADAIRLAAQPGCLLLSCGGIGQTPDDQTRQAAARAFGLPLERHPEGEALIVAQYGSQAFPNRVRMADFPRGAGLIPNPVNRVSGFFVGDCHFVPGFPEMAWPMIEWVLDTRYPQLRRSDPPVEYRLRAVGSAAEGDLVELMEAVLAKFPGVSLSSLPYRGGPRGPRHIEFGIRGERERAAAAYRWFDDQLASRDGIERIPLQAPP